jgi:hypothetical protein
MRGRLGGKVPGATARGLAVIFPVLWIESQVADPEASSRCGNFVPEGFPDPEGDQQRDKRQFVAGEALPLRGALSSPAIIRADNIALSPP